MAIAPGVAAPPPTRATAWRARPVLLATLGVPFQPQASAFAVDTAVEAAQPLIVVNVVALPPLAMSVNMRYDQLDDEPTVAEALRFPAEIARSLGVSVERLRVRSLRPVEALLELVAERRPGLVVFGPERSKLRPRRYRKAAQALCDRAPCLVWLPS